MRLTLSLTRGQSRRAFSVELTPFGALRASSTIHVRPLGGSPPPTVALLVHQLREGLAPLGQRQASAIGRRGRVAQREHRPHQLGLRYPEDLLGLFPALPLEPAHRGGYPVRSGRQRDPLREPPLVEGLLLKELRLPSHHQHDAERSVGQVGGAALTSSQTFKRLAIAYHHELPRLAVARAPCPRSHFEHVLQNVLRHGLMLLEEPHGPKRLQKADQRRRVGVAIQPPVGGRPLTSRLIHLPLPYSLWETIFITYCAAIVVRIRVSAQGVADSN